MEGSGDVEATMFLHRFRQDFRPWKHPPTSPQIVRSNPTVAVATGMTLEVQLRFWSDVAYPALIGE